MLPCFLPCTLPFRPANTSPSQRDTEKETKIPGDRPTNLISSSALLHGEFNYDWKDSPENQFLALEEGIDAADSKLDIDLGLLNLNEKCANEVASNCSHEGLPKVFLMTISESVYRIQNKTSIWKTSLVSKKAEKGIH